MKNIIILILLICISPILLAIAFSIFDIAMEITDKIKEFIKGE